jgi:hypothetical protein
MMSATEWRELQRGLEWYGYELKHDGNGPIRLSLSGRQVGVPAGSRARERIIAAAGELHRQTRP